MFLGKTLTTVHVHVTLTAPLSTSVVRSTVKRLGNFIQGEQPWNGLAFHPGACRNTPTSQYRNLDKVTGLMHVVNETCLLYIPLLLHVYHLTFGQLANLPGRSVLSFLT